MDLVGFGLVLGGFPTFALEAEEFGLMIAASELGQFAGEGKEVSALLKVVGRFDGGLMEAAADGDGEGRGKPVGYGNLAGVFFEALGFVDEGANPLASLLMAEPLLEAALFPFAEILLGDFVAGEVGGEDGADIVAGVEPGEELGAGFAVLKAAVQLVTDGAREAGDFAVSGHFPHLS